MYFEIKHFVMLSNILTFQYIVYGDSLHSHFRSACMLYLQKKNVFLLVVNELVL